MAGTAAVHIIDDDEAVRDSLAILLETHGLVVAAYPSAQAFLEQGELGPRDCVVTDVLMPGMDGLALLRALRTRGDPTPVIVVAGRPDADLVQTTQALGAFALIDKPFAAETLLRSVRAAMAQGASD